MRVLIVEPTLKSTSGHCYFYDQALSRQLKEMHVPVLILANRMADKDCLGIGVLRPCLSDIITDVFAATGSFKKMFSLGRAFSSSFTFLDRSLRGDKGSCIRDGDVVFVPTPYIFELLILGWLFFVRHGYFAQRSFKLKIMLRFRFIRKSRVVTAVLELLYRLACNVLLARLGAKVEFVTDSVLLKQEYEKILNKRLTVYPIPVYPFPEPFIPAAGKGSVSKDKIIASYVGGARYNKGFDLFADLAERFIRKAGSQLNFIAQVDIHPQTCKDALTVKQSAAKLEQLSACSGRLKLVCGKISTEAYYNILSDSHIVLLPYRDEAYKAATSNILVESILLGKVPVVSKNTWLAYELERYNLSRLTFTPEDVNSFCAVVEEAADNLEYFQKLIISMQNDWKFFHSARRLAEEVVV